MKSAHVIFKDSKYNYFTSVNSQQTSEQIERYFEGTQFNLGGMGYDHRKDCEIETDNPQTCIKCYANESESGASNHALNDLILFAESTQSTAEELNRVYTKIRDNKKADANYLLRQYFIIARRAYLSEFNSKGAAEHIKALTKEDVKEWVHLHETEFHKWKWENSGNKRTRK